jgi:hypothetical protein
MTSAAPSPRVPGRLPAAALVALIALAALLFLSFPASPASAQQAQQGQQRQGPPPLPPEVFKDQLPVTAADMPLAVDLLKAGRSGGATDKAIEELARKHGADPYRAAFVASRFGAGLLMLSNPNITPARIAEIYGTPLAVPAPAELEMIRSNETRLKAAIGWK